MGCLAKIYMGWQNIPLELKVNIGRLVIRTRAAMRPLLLRRAVNLASALRAYLPENFCDAANLRCAQLSFHTFVHLRGFILRYIQCTQITSISVSIVTHQSIAVFGECIRFELKSLRRRPRFFTGKIFFTNLTRRARFFS